MAFIRMAIRLSTQLCDPPRMARKGSNPTSEMSVRSMSASAFCVMGIRVASRAPYRKTARRLEACSSWSAAEARCAQVQCRAKMGTPTRMRDEGLCQLIPARPHPGG